MNPNRIYACADPKKDFQFTSLHVFENKKWWSEFQDELSKQKVTTAHGVRVLLHQFISEHESEIESECQVKRRVTEETAAASSVGSVFDRLRTSLQGEGHRRTSTCSAPNDGYYRHPSTGSSPMTENGRPMLGFHTVPTKGDTLDDSERSWGHALLGRRRTTDASSPRSGDNVRMTLGLHSVPTKGDTSRSGGGLDDSERSWGQALLGRMVPKNIDASASRSVGGLDESERSWGAGCLDDSFRNMDEYQNVIRGDTGIFSVQTVTTKNGDSAPSMFGLAKRRGSHNSLDSSDRSVNSLVSRLSGTFSMASLVSEIDVPIDEEDGSSACSSSIDSFYKFGEDFYSSQFDEKSALSLEIEGARDDDSVGSMESDYEDNPLEDYLCNHDVDEDHLPDEKDGKADEGSVSDYSDRSNNGEFEFPSSSRRVYKLKSLSPQSSVKLLDASGEATKESVQPPEKKPETTLYEEFGSNRSRGSSIRGLIRRVAQSANLDLKSEGTVTETTLKPPSHRNVKLRASRDKSMESVLTRPEESEPVPRVEIPKAKSVLIDWGYSDECLEMLFDNDNDQEESDASDFASEMATINSNEM